MISVGQVPLDVRKRAKKQADGTANKPQHRSGMPFARLASGDYTQISTSC